MSATVTSMKVILCLLLITVTVKPMSITGPSLVRYNPCALAVVHFDRLNETTWQGVVNLGLHVKVGDEDVTIDITFEDPVRISEIGQNTTLRETENKLRHILEIKAPWPPNYYFKVIFEQYTTNVPTVMEFAINNDTLCNDAVKASQKVESLSLDSSDHYKHICGRRSLPNAELTPMRSESHLGDWPWHVAIFLRDEDSNDTSYQCGGSIVSRTAVLTAGHCINLGGVTIPAERVIVVAGTNNYTDRYLPGRQTFIADKVVLHPNYAVTEATSDLAIIRVSQFRFTDYVQPVCLWGPIYDKTNLFGFQATMVGFGDTENGEQSNVLRAAYTLVQNDSTCIDSDEAVYRPILNEFTFCAGYGPNSTINPRNGDSGGGLVVPKMQPDNKISWFLRGVLSKCGMGPPNPTRCNPRLYTVYTAVGPHYGWIIHHSGLRFTNNVVEDPSDSLFVSFVSKVKLFI